MEVKRLFGVFEVIETSGNEDFCRTGLIGSTKRIRMIRSIVIETLRVSKDLMVVL